MHSGVVWLHDILVEMVERMMERLQILKTCENASLLAMVSVEGFLMGEVSQQGYSVPLAAMEVECQDILQRPRIENAQDCGDRLPLLAGAYLAQA